MQVIVLKTWMEHDVWIDRKEKKSYSAKWTKESPRRQWIDRYLEKQVNERNYHQ